MTAPGMSAAVTRIPVWARRVLGACALLVLSVFATWPLGKHLGQYLQAGDPAIFVWDLWWVKRSILHLDNPWWTDYLLAPQGTYLSFQGLVPIAGFAMAPITALAGPVISFNILKLLLPPITAWTASRAAGALGLRPWSAWIAGLLFGFSTIVVWRTNFHMNFGVGMALLPLPLYGVARYGAEHRTRHAVIAGVAGGAVLLADPTMAMFAAITAGSYLVVAALRSREWRAWGRLVLVAGGAALITGLPQLVMMARALSRGGYEPAMETLAYNWVAANASLSAMFSPASVRPWVPGNLEAWLYRVQYGEAAPAFGWSVLALAGVGLVAAVWMRRGGGPLRLHVVLWALALWVFAVILAMGPEVAIHGKEASVPFPITRYGQQLSSIMPYTWLTSIPLFADVRIPARFVMLGMFPLALLAGGGSQWLVERWRTAGTAVLGVLLVGALLESGFPDGAPTSEWVPRERPKLYAPVKADRSNSVVVDVPLGFLGGTSGFGSSHMHEDMLRATEHGHPAAGAYIARLGRPTLDALVAHPFYNDLVTLQGGIAAGAPSPKLDLAAARADATAINARWVVLWPDADRRVIPFLTATGYRRVVEDDGILLFRRG